MKTRFSSESRRLAGTFRPDRHVPSAAQMPSLLHAPPPPNWLTNERAIEEWKRLAPILAANRRLPESSLSSLANLCALHARIVDLYAQGAHPSASLLNQFRALTSDFSLSPNSTTKSDRTPQEAALDPLFADLLRDRPPPVGWEVVAEIFLSDNGRELWKKWGEFILRDWIREHPGTRPRCWWKFSAPRALSDELKKYEGSPYQRDLIQFRIKLTGEGCPASLNPRSPVRHHLGIPHWRGNPSQPPIFEQQYTYLKRHGLLLPGEGKSEEPPAMPVHVISATGPRPPRRPLGPCKVFYL